MRPNDYVHKRPAPLVVPSSLEVVEQAMLDHHGRCHARLAAGDCACRNVLALRCARCGWVVAGFAPPGRWCADADQLQMTGVPVCVWPPS